MYSWRTKLLRNTTKEAKEAANVGRVAQLGTTKNSPDYTPKVARANNAKREDASTPSQTSTDDVERANREERIRYRAYELYVQGGCQDGSEWRDWFDAEREFKEQEGEQT